MVKIVITVDRHPDVSANDDMTTFTIRKPNEEQAVIAATALLFGVYGRQIGKASKFSAYLKDTFEEEK